MSQLKKPFGMSDPLGGNQTPDALIQAARAAQVQEMQNQITAYNQAMNLGGQHMAGGAGGMAMGAGQGQYAQNAYNNPQTQAFLAGAISSAKSETRSHIADEVEKMAEELGAPTLLHAVVLAIRTMEIP